MLEAVKEKLEINKTVGVKKEMIFIEGEMIVPDSKPDVLNTIDATGVVCMQKKEVYDGKISIAGMLNTYIMYLPESANDNVRGMNTSVEFSEIINMPECMNSMNATITTKIISIESRVINERKVSVKASVEIEIHVYQKKNIEVISEIDNALNIQTLRKNIAMSSLVGSGSARSFIKETVSVGNAENIAEIVKIESYICNEDIKISYNKILVKSELYVKFLYLTEDSKIKSKNIRIPIVGFVDIENVVEGNVCDTSYEIKNYEIKLNQLQENSVYLEAEVDITADVYEEKGLNLIQDIYSTTEEIKCDMTNIVAIKNKVKSIKKEQIRQRIEIENLGNKDIVDAEVVVMVTGETSGSNYKIYDCKARIKFVIVDEKGQVTLKETSVNFQHREENIEEIENTRMILSVEIDNKDFVIQDGNQVDVSIDLKMVVDSYVGSDICIIDKLECVDKVEKEEYNVVIYVVKKGDTLWSIAKKYGSTVESIARFNSIENEDMIRPGEKLFIPKCIEVQDTQNLKTATSDG